MLSTSIVSPSLAGAVPGVTPSPGVRAHRPARWQGMLLAAGLGLGALALGRQFPLVGAPVFAIVLGMLWRNVLGLAPVFRPGVVFSSREVLKGSIIGLGFGLSLAQVLGTGVSSLAVTLVTLATAFACAWLLGRRLRLPGPLCALIGVGTAICGGSAIAALAPIIRPAEHETALSISVIFLFNVIAVLIFPPLGHWLGLTDGGFGLWAGTAINDTSSVVAAGYSYSAAAGDFATIVKLTRATLILPVCLLAALWVAHLGRGGGARVSLSQVFPWFILWFLVASAARTAGLVPSAWLAPLQELSQFLIVMALAAIGLSSDLRQMARAGVRPLLLGLGTWVAVAASSLGMQLLLGTL